MIVVSLTLYGHSNGPLYSHTVIGTMAAEIYPDPQWSYTPPGFYATPLTSTQQRGWLLRAVNQDHTIKSI